MAERDDALRELVQLSTKNGYLLDDEIDDIADQYGLSMVDYVWLTSMISLRNIITYESERQLTVSEESNYSDYAQADYNEIYRRVISADPSLENLISAIRAIRPAQFGEIQQLKYQLVDGNTHARQRLIDIHLRTMIKQALYFSEEYEEPIDECIQSACVGLLTGIDKYNPDRNGSLAGYLSMWIRQALNREMFNKRPLIYFPAHNKDPYFIYYKKYKGIEADPIDTSDDLVNLRWIKACTGIKNKKLLRDLYRQSVPLASLEELLETDEEKWILKFGVYSIDKELIEFDNKRALASFEIAAEKAHLTKIQKDVLVSRIGLYSGRIFTLEELGQEKGVTRERIRQIESKAIRKIRFQLGPLLGISRKRILELMENDKNK